MKAHSIRASKRQTLPTIPNAIETHETKVTTYRISKVVTTQARDSQMTLTVTVTVTAKACANYITPNGPE